MDNPKSRQEEDDDVADFKAEQSEQVIIRKELSDLTTERDAERSAMKPNDNLGLRVQVATRRIRKRHSSSSEKDTVDKKAKTDNLFDDYGSASDDDT